MTRRKLPLATMLGVGLLTLGAGGCVAQPYGYDRGPGYGYGYGGPPPPPPPRPYDDRRYGDPRGNGDDQRYDDRRYSNQRQDNRGDPGVARLEQRQQQYNQSITSLQQQHNQAVVSLQQQYNAGRLSRQQLDAGIAQLGRQYSDSVAQQQRALTR